MRKIVSFLLLIIFLAGSLKMTLAAHYCGGKVAKIKLGVGKIIASCGMENGKEPCEGETLGVNCCKDRLHEVITGEYLSERLFLIDYLFSEFFLHARYKLIFRFFEGNSCVDGSLLYKPPQGSYNAIYLPFIRVFRI